MKQNSIFALVLGAILVLTISSTEMVFADYDKYSDDRNDDDDYEKGHDSDDRNDDDDDYEKGHDSDDRNDDDDKWEKESKS